MNSRSVAFLESLISAPSPSGYEQPVARLYRAYVSRFADDVSTDVHGNAIAVLNPGARMKIMLVGHMDEIGFIIHYISADGLLYFSTIGGHDSSVALGQAVWVHGRERVPGVVGRKAIHLLDENESKKKPEIGDLWIDIGAFTAAEAEAVVSLGDVVTFQREFQRLLGDRATARAFDNKAGLFIVAEAVRLLKEDGGLAADVGVHAVGAVQEEIGSRGAKTAAFYINAQSGLAVDMGHSIDTPGAAKERHGPMAMGQGPGISRGANTNPTVFAMLTQAAKASDIPYQVDVSPAATPTDANALQLSRSGMAAGLLSVPIRYMHTPCEVLSLTDVEHTGRLIASYCRMVKADTNFAPR
jgi:putative aminopeptidase FrvX